MILTVTRIELPNISKWAALLNYRRRHIQTSDFSVSMTSSLDRTVVVQEVVVANLSVGSARVVLRVLGHFLNAQES